MRNPATAVRNLPDTTSEPSGHRRLELKSRLALIGLIDEQMRSKAASTPIFTDLFSDLCELVDATAEGSKIDRLNPISRANGFHVFELTAEGTKIGQVNLLYLNKPIPCYFLVYVEVLPLFRKKGLGHRILSHLREFLDEKGALGILDNVIPRNDPTYAIYYRQAWEPIEQIIGPNNTDEDDNYMLYIPPQFQKKDIGQAVSRLLYHIKRKRTAIDMRDNEGMVKQTLEEFKELYEALLTYFEPEIAEGRADPCMRFLFTRFVTKFIFFRRRIGELIGYTGGESTEQIELAPDIAALPVLHIAPKDIAGETFCFSGNRTLCMQLLQVLDRQPAKTVESLPNALRPDLKNYLASRNLDSNRPLTIGDLLDLGYDPSQFKELCIDGKAYVLQRILKRSLPEFEEKQKLLDRLAPAVSDLRVLGARLQLNAPLALIQDMGNAYVLRRKIEAIPWDEAQVQFQQDPHLKRLSDGEGLEQLLLATIRAAGKKLTQTSGIDTEIAFDTLTWMVSWDISSNRPGLFMDFSGPVFESIWIS
ncbi:MAG: GNAT family N-acetyltransferase [Desulfobacteraceae bacterium]|nr:GNAT family N-acetyltransferase [Desulfobacteraceae bacterium]